jgi:endonuclease/exonuclease/phosphatase family metal-dependent hydrolase
MTELSIVTANILIDLSLWKKRRPLLVEQLAAEDPDLIALQEVALKEETSNAHWIADELNALEPEREEKYQVYLCPKTGPDAELEGIAILSRFPVKRHDPIDLLTQNRVAQFVELKLEHGPLFLINGHFYWERGESKSRKEQIELLLDFLDTLPASVPVIVAGDFNSEPDTPSIEIMRRYFDSAHRAVHGAEPEFTCPTPLPTSILDEFRKNILQRFGKESNSEPEWCGTVDYIFVDPRLHTLECRVILDQPDKGNHLLYPSDHFGLYSLIRVN